MNKKIHLRATWSDEFQMPQCHQNGNCEVTDDKKKVTCIKCSEGNLV